MTTEQQLRSIPVERVRKNPANPRLIFRQEELDTLMISIDHHGVQVPITVYRDGSEYVLIDGERRWRCAQKLNHQKIPALIQDKPSPLQNLLLMYNIHALREQWDYFTIASNLKNVIELFEGERGFSPNESQLSEATGLTRGQIRRCNLLISLPDRFTDILLQELEKPKVRQKLSEDFFIEMEKALKTVRRRFPDYEDHLDQIRDTLINKFQTDKIGAVTDFRMLAKLSTAPENLDLPEKRARGLLDEIFDPNADRSIKEIFEQSVEFKYDERRAIHQLDFIIDFLNEATEKRTELDDDLRERLKQIVSLIKRLLR